MPSLAKYFAAAVAIGLGSIYYYSCTGSIASVGRVLISEVNCVNPPEGKLSFIYVEWKHLNYAVVMFSHNLRRLGRQVFTQFIQKSPRPIHYTGSVCLVLLPIRHFALSEVHCLSGKTAAKSSSDLADMSGNSDYKSASSIYDFTVKDTYGNDVSLEKYKGNVVLIVNIASKCGLTKNNYKKITDLKEKYYDKGLRVLSFPCNQFSSQMPEADGEEMVCHLKDAKADVGDVFQKIDVNGDNAHPLYKYLKHKQSGTLGNAIKWNFTKFLVNKDGQAVNRYSPTTDPMDIAKDIEKLL